jgi:hypothetical protein
MADHPLTPARPEADDTAGLARIGRALLVGVLEGATLGMIATLAGIPVGGIAGIIAGTLAGAGAALLMPLLRSVRLGVVRIVLGTMAALAQVLVYPAFLGASVGQPDVLAVTLPAGAAAALIAATVTRWIITGQFAPPGGRPLGQQQDLSQVRRPQIV